jgi:hypothetical protein
MSELAPHASRKLPLAPLAAPALRHLPLANHARAVDRQAKPINAVWELTLVGAHAAYQRFFLAFSNLSSAATSARS